MNITSPSAPGIAWRAARARSRELPRRVEKSLKRYVELAGYISLLLAVGWLAEGWIAWAVQRRIAVDATQAAVLVLAMDCGETFVLWSLRTWLTQRFGFRGADRAVLVIVIILLTDILAELYIIGSKAPGFKAYTFVGPYTLVLAYPMIEHFAIGIARIALGYSLLRLPGDRRGPLALYAYAQIAVGAAFSSMTLGVLAIVPGVGGCVFLAVFLLRAANESSTELKRSTGTSPSITGHSAAAARLK